jgi:hemolysin-activating ACP:hemolysin acyltransferase
LARQFLFGLIFSLVVSLLVIRAYADQPQHQMRAQQTVQEIYSALNRSYPHIQFSVESEFFDPETAAKYQRVLDILLQAILERTVNPRLQQITVTGSEYGSVKDDYYGRSIVLNIHEYNSPQRWRARISFDLPYYPFCTKTIPTTADIRGLFGQESSREVFVPSNTLEMYNIDLSRDPSRLASVVQELLRIESDSAANTGSDFATHLLCRAKNCQSADCVFERVFGSVDQGYLMAFALDQFHLNSSYAQDPARYENWTLAEMQDLVEVLVNIPPIMRKSLRSGQKMVALNQAAVGSRENSIANAVMEFFPYYRTLSKAKRQGYLVHEILHHTHEAILDQEEEAWNTIGGWIRVDGLWQSNPQATNFVSPYARRVNPEEDFTETGRMLWQSPGMSYEIAPKKTEFIRQLVWGGIDINGADSCQQVTSYDFVWEKIQHRKDAIVRYSTKNCEDLIYKEFLRKHELSKDFFKYIDEPSPNTKKISQHILEQLNEGHFDYSLCFQKNVLSYLSEDARSESRVNPKIFHRWIKALWYLNNEKLLPRLTDLVRPYQSLKKAIYQKIKAVKWQTVFSSQPARRKNCSFLWDSNKEEMLVLGGVRRADLNQLFNDPFRWPVMNYLETSCKIAADEYNQKYAAPENDWSLTLENFTDFFNQ